MIDDIPQAVLHDYQNRTIVTVENPRWDDADHSLLTADVVFAELEPLGPLPFTATNNADTDHGQEIWDKASAGDYGPVADFVPPTPEEIRASMHPLTARQFRLGLLANDLLHNVEDAIAALEEPARSEAKIEWEYATTIERNHSLVATLSSSLVLTDEQIDTMWEEALSL